MKQEALYAPIQNWLTTRGFQSIVTGEKRLRMVISVDDLAPNAYKVPDLVAIDQSNNVAIVEVEQNKRRFFDALGRCMVWRCMAVFVWMAYPKTESFAISALDKLGVGFLTVDCDTLSVEEKISLPSEGTELHAKVLELHPTDSVRQQQIAAAISRQLSHGGCV